MWPGGSLGGKMAMSLSVVLVLCGAVWCCVVRLCQTQITNSTLERLMLVQTCPPGRVSATLIKLIQNRHHKYCTIIHTQNESGSNEKHDSRRKL